MLLCCSVGGNSLLLTSHWYHATGVFHLSPSPVLSTDYTPLVSARHLFNPCGGLKFFTLIEVPL